MKELLKVVIITRAEKLTDLKEAMDELRLATVEGFKSKHDDFIDTISMLSCLKVWKPSQASGGSIQEDSVWDMPTPSPDNGIDSYLV